MLSQNNAYTDADFEEISRLYPSFSREKTTPRECHFYNNERVRCIDDLRKLVLGGGWNLTYVTNINSKEQDQVNEVLMCFYKNDQKLLVKVIFSQSNTRDNLIGLFTATNNSENLSKIAQDSKNGFHYIVPSEIPNIQGFITYASGYSGSIELLLCRFSSDVNDISNFPK